MPFTFRLILLFIFVDNRVPTLRGLVALTVMVTKSHELTPQQPEEEIPRRWPLDYGSDRYIAQCYAEELTSKFLAIVAREDLTEILELVERNLSFVHLNRRQRDLREEGKLYIGEFFQDNEHELRITGDPKSSWVGDPPPARDEEGDLSDGGWSEGEDIPYYDFSPTLVDVSQC